MFTPFLAYSSPANNVRSFSHILHENINVNDVIKHIFWDVGSRFLRYADDRRTRNLYKKLARVNLREQLVRVFIIIIIYSPRTKYNNKVHEEQLKQVRQG